MIITLDLPPEIEKQLQRAARTQGKDVAAFLLENVQRQLRPDVLPENEANLLQAINAPLAPETRQHRDALLALQQQRELTATEQETLAHLIDTIELANAKRWQSLADLAESRNLSLAEIARELEIPLA